MPNLEHESREIKVMRAMAWERAKGELFSMLWTYYENSPTDEDWFAILDALITNFIEDVENQELQT